MKIEAIREKIYFAFDKIEDMKLLKAIDIILTYVLGVDISKRNRMTYKENRQKKHKGFDSYKYN